VWVPVFYFAITTGINIF